MQYTVLYYQCFEFFSFFYKQFYSCPPGYMFSILVFVCHQMHSLQRITLCLSSEMSHLTYLTYVFDLKCFTTVTSFAPDED